MVVAIDHLEGQGLDLVPGRGTAPVGLDQFLDPRHHVTHVVQHRLFGVEGEVGEQDAALVAAVLAQTLGQCRRHR